MSEPTSAPLTARARARAEMTRQILDASRRHLAEAGAAGLSLRAVARDLGMVSSAVYRYVPTRDALLTALIVEAFDSIADVAERADGARRRTDLVGRWLAVCRAVREWALAHPHEYALIYGTPVPGYQAPQDTAVPVQRASAVVVDILRDAHRLRRLRSGGGPVPRRVRQDVLALVRQFDVDVPVEAMIAGIIGWTHLFGAISFELFGHRNRVVEDHDAFFDHEMRQIAATILR
ncbi:MAG: TetR/AcrR family transcriptional regulator [Angustibacter sp.]